MSDEIIYPADGVQISKTLAKFGDVSFPISGIGSVYIRKPTFWDRYKSVLASLFLGAIVWVVGVMNQWVWLQFVAGSLALLGTLGSFALPSKLMVRTASGDQQAFEHQSRAKLEELKSAIETAVTLRG